MRCTRKPRSRHGRVKIIPRVGERSAFIVGYRVGAVHSRAMPHCTVRYNVRLTPRVVDARAMDAIAIFREECEKVGRRYDPLMVATARPLQMIHHESERVAAYATRKRVLSVIGDLARDKLPDRVEDDTASLLGMPDEVIAKLKELEAGGATNILLVDPNASVANLRAFAREVMPAFTTERTAAAE